MLGVGLSVGVGEGEGGGVSSDGLGEGDAVVVATGADAHDAAIATTSASGTKEARIDSTILERVPAHGVGEHVPSVRARTAEKRPRP